MSLLDLPTRDDDGNLNVVVESPRGSRAKLALDRERGVFVVKRALPHGVVYPFDWGFVAGTRAADGDPLDAFVVADAGTWPGLVIPCRPIGVVSIRQRETARSKWVRNDRIAVVSADDPELAHVDALPRALVASLEAFFVRVGELAHAAVRVDGWHGPKTATAVIAAAERKSTA